MTDSTKSISIFLVDDQAILRAAFRSLLERDPAFNILGDSGSPRSALEEISRLAPDVVLLDISMPELSGLDMIPMIRKDCPNTRILILTHHEAERIVDQALAAGAEGYLSKDSDERELSVALHAVHRGDLYISPRVTKVLMTRGLGKTSEASTRVDSLTPREREVFQLLALGRSNKEVAQKLEVSLGTAKKHRENLQRKLECNSAAELARLAIREGLLDL
ncbi:MAG: DNA-binding NarL/FixJ family response regulator [Planctomycetota bacterium]